MQVYCLGPDIRSAQCAHDGDIADNQGIEVHIAGGTGKKTGDRHPCSRSEYGGYRFPDSSFTGSFDYHINHVIVGDGLDLFYDILISNIDSVIGAEPSADFQAVIPGTDENDFSRTIRLGGLHGK